MNSPKRKHCPGSRDERGFTLIEVLLGMVIMAIGLLAMAALFPVAYLSVSDAGKVTMGITAAKQMLEDVRSVPFDNLINLNGFDTNNSATLPANAPERDFARRWRFALAGEGNGFTFTTTEKARWGAFTTGAGTTFGGRGRITVTAQGATLSLVTITITVPRRPQNIAISTLISKL